jgi:hypothetical protein
MSAKTITVIATFQAKPGKEAELKKALISLVVPTHKEAGCFNYDLHASPEDPAKFLFHENWTRFFHCALPPGEDRVGDYRMPLRRRADAHGNQM